MDWENHFTFKSGVLYWKFRKGATKEDRRFNSRFGGKAAGQDDNGYIRIRINGKRYKAHRIIWEMHFGEIPLDRWVDHIDRDRKNNSLENLRLVDFSYNSRNRNVRKNSRTGVTGVMWKRSDKIWEANITERGNIHYLYFGKDFFEACCARFSAEIKYGFARP